MHAVTKPFYLSDQQKDSPWCFHTFCLRCLGRIYMYFNLLVTFLLNMIHVSSLFFLVTCSPEFVTGEFKNLGSNCCWRQTS